MNNKSFKIPPPPPPELFLNTKNLASNFSSAQRLFSKKGFTILEMVIGLALMGILTAVFLSQTKLMFKTQKTVDAKFVRTQLMQEFSDIIKHPNSKDYAISTTHRQNGDLKKYTNGENPSFPVTTTTDVTIKPKANAYPLDLINPYKEVANEILIKNFVGTCYDRNGAAIKPTASSCADSDARWKVTAQWFALAQNDFGIQVKIEPLPSLQLPFLVDKYIDTTNTVSASSSEGETKCYRADEKEVFIGCGAADNSTHPDDSIIADGSILAGEGSTGVNNTFVGLLAGQANTTGYKNTFIGSSAGLKNTDGYFNTFLGSSAGFSNTRGGGNTFIGASAGESNTTHGANTFVGHTAGQLNIAGGGTFIGSSAGRRNTTGRENTFIGTSAGAFNTTGAYNTFLGSSAGLNTTVGDNTFIGSLAGEANTTGRENTFLGSNAGFGYKTGDNNISIGDNSGCRSGASDNKRCINSNRNIFIGANYRPLTSTAEINNLLNIGNVILGKTDGIYPSLPETEYPTSNGIKIRGSLEVTGLITGTHTSSSDSRLKKEVKNLKSQLSKLLILKPKTYYWKNKTSGKRKQFGLIAQDVKPIFPNLVHEDESKKKLLKLNYNGLIPVIIQSFKEFYSFTTKAIESLKKFLINIETKLTAKNKKLERELSSLKKEINLLKKEINSLKKTELDKEKK